jgi:dTDP-N-acetylfucosamine:lipid II N-acetylfucosaminyltransferase
VEKLKVIISGVMMLHNGVKSARNGNGTNQVHRKRILHLMTTGSESVYHKSFMDLVYSSPELYEKFENVFFFLNSKKSRSLTGLLFANEARKADLIVAHGLFGFACEYLYLCPGAVSKTRWVIWGGDLYFDLNAEPDDSNKAYIKELYRRIHKHIKRSVVRNVNGFITVISRDIEFAETTYKTQKSRFGAFYPSPVNFDLLDNSINDSSKYTDDRVTKTILLGNSASNTNEHYEVIDFLAQLSKEMQFQVICPLSYGNKEYASQVDIYGRKKIGDNFVSLLTFMQPPDYAKVLLSADIAIMNHRNQEAVGTILALLYSGKKVYIRKDVSTFQWLDALGVKVFDTEILLSSPSLNSIFEFTLEDKERNKQIIKDYFSKENCIRMWKTVLSD